MAEAGPAPVPAVSVITSVDDLPPPTPADSGETATSETRFPFIIADRYVAERELGRGMARVFLAQDRRLKRPVAWSVREDDIRAALTAYLERQP